MFVLILVIEEDEILLLKKLLSGIVLGAFCLTPMSALASVEDVDILFETNTSEIATIYEYPVLPGTEEWAAFTTTQEMENSCQIPEQLLRNMSTEDLAQTVLKYPLLPNMLAYDAYEEGYNEVKNSFNGLQELVSRENAGSILYQMYLKIGQIKIDNYLDAACLEILLNQNDFINTMKDNERQSLKEEAQNMFSNQHTTVLEKMTGNENDDTVAFASKLYILSPGGSMIFYRQNEEMSWAQRMANDLYIRDTYPNVKELQGSTAKYNCHAYAFFLPSKEVDIWIDDPSPYMEDGSYRQVTSPTSDDIICYNNNDDVVGTTKGNHSGRVKSASGYDITVVSKWGDYGLYEHDKNYSIYSSERTRYSYWR